jgi:hypothetical protein
MRQVARSLLYSPLPRLEPHIGTARRLSLLLCLCAATASAQTPPHSGGRTPFRGPDHVDTRGIRAIALAFEDCPVRVNAGAVRSHRGELVFPLDVINTGQTDIGGFRLLALVMASDGTIRDRQPVEVTKPVRAGKRHATDVTLHTRPTPGEFVVVAVENVIRSEAPCELARADIEAAAQQTVRNAARK